ncbi:SDR family NAD(P)-dependent oxidoreductase [Allokutzneria albata]|uniref:NAD(P)-dependent dehydrogenase, short-chain alcohol dehydrogenase family n=1 Tax=Allokutzneria albata TaxID=211114 RepID=A0A1G9TLS8_ALLAB|nr:glucose 1-dehydrogenase [Allokutzneria albata]SDM48726.1 NAD(P)-dependent dehydrogenase, short-chain alcohol dehydrogenase family [Allokutzneria albata]
MTELAGATALVTGGGTGIGRGIALALSDAGATVAVLGRSREPLEQTAKLISDAGGSASVVTADVTDSASVSTAVRTVVDRHGSLDVAVNNAGILTATGPLTDIDEEHWDRLLTVNVTGVMLSMKHELRQMTAQGSGVIINVASSIGAHKTLPNMAAYGATKAAVVALTKAAALDHVAQGVRINAVSPGSTDTPMSLRPGETEDDRARRLRAALPLGRVGRVEEIAAAVRYLASPDAAFMIGQTLVLDGGSAA